MSTTATSFSQVLGDSIPDNYKDLASLTQRADAVVVGTVLGNEARHVQLRTGKVQLRTFDVTEVIKGPSVGLRGAISIGLPEQHGTKGPRDRYFTPLPEGRYVVFLVWDKRVDAYVVLYDTTGIYGLEGDRVKTSGRTALAQKQVDRSAATFVAELRKYGGTWEGESKRPVR